MEPQNALTGLEFSLSKHKSRHHGRQISAVMPDMFRYRIIPVSRHVGKRLKDGFHA